MGWYEDLKDGIKICNKPIAGYDKEKKAAYIEYANGEKICRIESQWYLS